MLQFYEEAINIQHLMCNKMSQMKLRSQTTFEIWKYYKVYMDAIKRGKKISKLLT